MNDRRRRREVVEAATRRDRGCVLRERDHGWIIPFGDAGLAVKRGSESLVGSGVFPTCRGPLDPHEVIPRSAWRDGIYVLSNVVMVCRAHHDWIGDYPDTAHTLGLHGYSHERPDYQKIERMVLNPEPLAVKPIPVCRDCNMRAPWCKCGSMNYDGSDR